MAEVKLVGLEKKFGDISVIHRINLDIADGEFAVLVGPSGCGKTTTLRMIAGLEEATGGNILFDGKSVERLEPKDRDIAMVFQSYALYPHMSVRDNMAFSLRMKGVSSAEKKRLVGVAAEMLDITDLLGPQAPAIVRRPAPARRDGAGAGARAEGISVRRTAVESRCRVARADAHRDQAHPPAAAHHHHLRHP